MTKVSVILVVGNHVDLLRGCLDSLVTQTMDPIDYEIFVVETVSPELLDAYREFYRAHSIRSIHRPVSQLVSGLNEAVARAEGAHCLFVDSRMRAAPDLISEHFRVQQATGGIIGLGTVQIQPGIEPKRRLDPYSKHWENHGIFLERQDHTVSWVDCRLGNLSMPRKKILTIGGFRTELSKSYDLELVYRLAQYGLPIIKIDSAIVFLDEMPSRRELRQSEEKRGAAYIELWKRNPRLLSCLFGNFHDSSLRGVLLRRLLIALSISPCWMEMLGFLIWHPGLRDKWDAFLQQYCFWRGAHAELADPKTWQQLTYGVPILMYHAFCANTERSSRYIHSIQKFRVQLQLLKILGYRVIRLEEYLECLNRGNLPSMYSIVITIDDGYSDNLVLTYPVLKHFNVPATIFLVSGYLGKVNDWDEDSLLTGRQILNGEEARKMQDELITFGAHTHTHPWLRKISKDKARDEIIESRIELERELGLPVRLFSYPHGDYDDLTTKLVDEAGFLGACTTQTGLNTPASSRFALHRTEIRGNFSIIRFLTAVWFGK